MTQGKMAQQAGELIGFKQALMAFSQAMGKFGGSSGQILFVAYPDGTIAPKFNGALNPHQFIAAAKALMHLADDQIAAMEAEMRDMKAAANMNGVVPPHIIKGG